MRRENDYICISFHPGSNVATSSQPLTNPFLRVLKVEQDCSEQLCGGQTDFKVMEMAVAGIKGLGVCFSVKSFFRTHSFLDSIMIHTNQLPQVIAKW